MKHKQRATAYDLGTQAGKARGWTPKHRDTEAALPRGPGEPWQCPGLRRDRLALGQEPGVCIELN